MSIFDEAQSRLDSKRYDRLKAIKTKAKLEDQQYPYATYQGKDPIDGTDIVQVGANEPVSGFKLISNSPIEKGDRVALRKNDQGGLQRVDALNRTEIIEEEIIEEPTPLIAYLLLETGTNILYVSDGVAIEEIAAFDILSTESSSGIAATITKTGINFSDWIVTGSYRKNEAESSITANRLVSFYITPSETLTEEVKYLSEDAVNELIYQQHLDDPLSSDTDLILSSQFRVGETIYSSTDNFVNPITVTASNEARGALTTRFASGVDVGYGWIVANDHLKDNSDESFRGGKRGASLFRGRLNTSSLPNTPPDNDAGANMETGGYYTFGTYEGDPAFIVRVIFDDIDFEGGLPAKIRFFRDVLAESDQELIDLSTDTIQNDVYDLTPLGTIPVGGGFLWAYAITLNGDSVSALPIPIKDTIALFLIDGDEFTYTDVYFNQKENFVRRKMYEFTMTGDHDADVWLNQERMIIQKVGYRYIQGYKTPSEEDPDQFIRSGFKHYREIGIDIRQGLEDETQVFTRTLDLIGERILRSNSFLVDATGEQNLVEQINYFAELDPAILPVPIDGNLISNDLVILSLLLNTEGDLTQIQQTIDLIATPLESIQDDINETTGIDTDIYGILSQSAWLIR